MTNSNGYSVAPAEAAAALLKRRRARRELVRFTEYTYPQYTAEQVHQVIAGTLDKVIEGSITRLMIFAPPQHGKSELVSVRLPAYWLGRHPDKPVILASYAASLAESKSRGAREIVNSREYSLLFPEVRLSEESHAADEWQLARPARGGMIARGIGGAITGHGAGLGIIDDPFENWEQAQSAAYRKRAWEWYRTTFRTRIWEGGAIVLIMTRWHQLDLAGMILADQADQWEVLRLPAIAESQGERDHNAEYLGLPTGQPDPLNREAGEALAPRRFSLKALQSLKVDVGPMGWSAEYQGVPRASEGNRFKEDWFQVVETVPAEALEKGTLVRYWDKAATQDGGCFTAGVLICLYHGTIYIVDVVHGQWESDRRDMMIKSTTMMDAASYNGRVTMWFEQEPGSSGLDVARATVKLLAGYPVFADKVTGDKDVRLGPFEAQAAGGNVRVVKGRWNRTYIEEFLEIPNGAYRDQTDATSGAYNKAALGAPSAAEWIREIEKRQEEKEHAGDEQQSGGQRIKRSEVGRPFRR